VRASKVAVRAQLGEDPDHRLAQVVLLVALGGGEGVLQHLERGLVVALVPRRPCGVEVVAVARQAGAGGQAGRGEVLRERLERLLGLVVGLAGDHQPGERDGGCGVARVERQRLAQSVLVAARLLDQPVGLRGHERVEERLDLLGRDRAGELVDDLAVLERLDRGDALDAERGGELLIGIDVDLGQLNLPVARLRRLLERRRELPAGTAPGGPEVHDDGHFLRALDDVPRESCFVYVLDCGHIPSLGRGVSPLRP
jgi:hypothetical protein